MKKFLKWIAYLLAAFILLVSIIAGVTQTGFFREKLRSFARTQLDSLLDADVHLGALRGNLLTGFSLDSVAITVRGEQFVTVERLNIRYDLIQIFSKNISVGSLTLVRPRIAVVRGRDSVWNFTRMIRPTPDDSTTRPFAWPIAVDRFEILDGTFRLVDSASLAERGHEAADPSFVEYHDFAVHDLKLLMTSVRVAPEEKRAKIASLSFVSDTPAVQLNRFSGEFLVTTKEASVKNLIVQTGRSDLHLTASMKNFDLLGGIDLADLKTKPVELALSTKEMDLDELQRFIAQLDFLHGRVNCTLVADGEFGRLHLQQLDLKTRSTDLHFAGTVANLHRPSDLRLQLQCRGSTVRYADARELMPSFALPDYDSLGTADLEFDFDGTPLDFKTTLSVRSAFGNLSTKDAALKIGGSERLRYAGEFAFTNFDIFPLLQDERRHSALNMRVKINGGGTSLEKVRATLDAEIDSSDFEGERVGPSRITLTCAERKVEGTLALALGSMRSQLRAALNRADNARPTFSVEGEVASLNIAEFLHDKSYTSDLSFRVRADGEGLEWEKVSGNAEINLFPSTYKEYHIDSSLVHVSIDQRDPVHSSIVLESELADFRISGRFDLDYIIGLIRYEASTLQLAIGQRFRSLDSTLATSLDIREVQAAGKHLAGLNKVLDTEYQLTVKNLEPLSILAGDRTFNAVGTIEGALKGNYDDLSGNAQVALKEFFYGNADSGVLVQDGAASLRFSDLKPVNPLADLTLRVRVDAGKMHVNRTKLDTLKFGIFYDKEYAGFVVQADYDQVLHTKTKGQIGVTDDGVQFTLSDLSVAYQDFGWQADDGASIAVNKNGMRVQNVLFRRDSASVAINGHVFTGGSLSAAVHCRKMNLSDLKYIVRKEETIKGRRGFEGIASLDMQAGGTLKEPVYTVVLRAEDVFFRGFRFGEVRGALDYKERELAAELQIDNRTDTTRGVPDLTVRGSLPINLALADVDERLSDKPMDFTVKTDGLQMSLLDPLLPTFNELTGTLKANFKIGGTPKKPNFTGTMSIEGSSFLFEPNNMYYKLDGSFRPEGERITVLSTTIRNIDADNKPGRIGVLHVAGDFALRELVPSDFNLTLSGQLLVVNKNTRTSSLAVYGELPVEVASGGLRFTGNIEQSLLRGEVLVRNSSLAFPPTTTAAKEDTFSIPFKVVNDTLRVAEDAHERVSRYFSSVPEHQESAGPGAERRTPSFIDGLRYDLRVEFAGSNNEVRMIFNPATNEELVANITGKVNITEDGKTWGGTLDVNRASYNFYGKRFDAEGTMTYTGDFLNPEMNIVATYEGTRQYDEKSPQENVVVTYKITGTRFAPKSEISMKIDGVDYSVYKTTPTSGDVQSDALTFLITGKFPLSRGERNDVADGLSNTVTTSLIGGATSLLTSTLSEFLRSKTGFITSFEFGYDASDKRTDIRLGGTAFKGYWRYGGKILEDPFNNANFSILYSFGDIFDRPSLRNFMFELERKVDTSTLFGSIETRKEVNSARFFYRISF